MANKFVKLVVAAVLSSCAVAAGTLIVWKYGVTHGSHTEQHDHLGRP